MSCSTLLGVWAPEVTLGAYRVFGCDDSTTSDVMLAAMEFAWKDRMDVLNMSMGSAFRWPQHPTAQGAGRLVRKGVVCETPSHAAGSSTSTARRR